MARKPKAETSAPDDRLKLLNALAFASIATKDNDEGKTSFVAFRDHFLTAENDTFSVGIGVDVGLELCPHAEKFKAALQQCGQQFQLTQIDMQSVSLRSGNFRATIPALSIDMAGTAQPDTAIARIDDRITRAFEACGKAMGKGTRVYHNSVLLRSGTAVGTNGGIAIEYWHGIDLPGPMGIPKKTVDAMVKLNKPLASFGFSTNSATFFFEDGSYIKTRLMSEPWPNIDRLFTQNNGPFQPVWPEFFFALKAVDAFINNDVVFFHDGALATHNSIELGASYRVAGLPPEYVFSATYWRILEPFITKIQMATNRSSPTAFQGANVRGLIMGRSG